MSLMVVRSVYSAFPAGAARPNAGHDRKTLWCAKETDSRVNAEVFALWAGAQLPTRYYPNHMAMVICWQGSGRVTIAAPLEGQARTWAAPYYTFPVGPLDSFLIPKAALHSFVADRDSAEPWLLLVVNPLDSTPLSEEPGTIVGDATQPFRWTKKLSVNGSYDPETKAEIYDFDKNSNHRAKRIRVWGREMVNEDGSPDPAKAQFHVVAYPFWKRQVNPAHFHPRSVELMIGIDGETEVSTRDKLWKSKPEDIPQPGWSKEERTGRLAKGDTSVIGLGDVHQYINHKEESSIVLAMQTPQPIMHTLEHETNF